MTPFKQFKETMLRRFFKMVVSLFATSSAVAQSDHLNVLFIGNSYTHMNDMPVIFGKICDQSGMNVYVEKSAQSGASFRVHSERKELFEAIASRKWDYVVLQGYSREMTYPKEVLDTATIPYLNKIVRAVRKNNPSTSLLFYMTWGYDNGFAEREEISSFDRMSDTIANGYGYLRSHYDFPVVPVGMVWKDVKRDSLMDLYASDREHPSQNGSFLAANTFFEAIFGIPAPTDLKIITEENALLIREKVSGFLKVNRSSYGLDKDFLQLKIDESDEDFALEYNANFPNASAIHWDFNGEKSDTWSGRIHFRSLGIQIVRAEVCFENGTNRNFVRRINLDALDNRRRRKKTPDMTA